MIRFCKSSVSLAVAVLVLLSCFAVPAAAMEAPDAAFAPAMDDFADLFPYLSGNAGDDFTMFVGSTYRFNIGVSGIDTLILAIKATSRPSASLNGGAYIGGDSYADRPGVFYFRLPYSGEPEFSLALRGSYGSIVGVWGLMGNTVLTRSHTLSFVQAGSNYRATVALTNILPKVCSRLSFRVNCSPVTGEFVIYYSGGSSQSIPCVFLDEFSGYVDLAGIDFSDSSISRIELLFWRTTSISTPAYCLTGFHLYTSAPNWLQRVLTAIEGVSGSNGVLSKLQDILLITGNGFDSLFAKMDGFFQQLDERLVFFMQEVDTAFRETRDAIGTAADRVIEAISAWGDEIVNAINGADEPFNEDNQEVQDGVGQLDTFENDVMGSLNAQLPDFNKSVNVSTFLTPMAWVSSYMTSIFNSLGALNIIFVLPIFIGVYFYALNRMPGAINNVKRHEQRNDMPKKDGGDK